MTAVGLSGINDEANHSIHFLHKEESSEGTCSCRKTQNLRVNKLVKKFITLVRIFTQRGIPVHRDSSRCSSSAGLRIILEQG